MDLDLLDTIQKRLLAAPENKWDEILDKRGLTDSEMCELSDRMMGVAAKLAKLSQYVGKRGGFGRGDSGHEKALQDANKRQKAIRKALGYSYP